MKRKRSSPDDLGVKVHTDGYEAGLSPVHGLGSDTVLILTYERVIVWIIQLLAHVVDAYVELRHN